MRQFLSVLIVFSFLPIFGQYSVASKKYNYHHKAKFVKLENPTFKSHDYIHSIKAEYGLGDLSELEQEKIVVNQKSGFTHEKYEQTYRGLEVIGGHYTLHKKNGLVHKSTGSLLPLISINVNPSLSESDLIQIAKDFLCNELLNEESNSIDLSFDFHGSKLCVIDQAYPKFSGDYRLAYQIFAEADTRHPIHEKLYVDAMDGNVIANFTEVCEHSVPGKAQTRYYGLQDIVADSIGPNNYILRDSTRGNGVFTLNGPDKDQSLDWEYEDFHDADNLWDNANNDFDEIAGDAHYCTSSFYDFLLDEFGWDGLDNNGLEMVSVVQVRNRYYLNAFWDGEKVSIGNGTCDEYGPLTVLDVIAHEFTHGLIDYSCDLLYQDESGALNESLADIFGKTLEYKYDRENFNWLIGNKFRIEDSEGGFRDMKNPNEINDPKFYLGEKWQFSSFDRGGVHSNSGVFNYWYYLLVEGESGVNEVGYEYNVEAIGIDDAMQIAWGCMTGYFGENTDYPEAMRLSIEQTADLFGENSQQYESVLEAWATVGLYYGIDDADLSLESIVDEYFGCLDSEIFPEVIVRNSGEVTQDAGTLLRMSCVYDGGNVEINEDFYLIEDMVPGDSIIYTFENGISYFPDIQDDITINVLNEDSLYFNNSLELELEFTEINEADVELVDFSLLFDDDCNPTKIGFYSIQFRNSGCGIINSEDTLMIRITTDLEVVEQEHLVYGDFDPGNQLTSQRSFEAELQPGFTEFQAELLFERDGVDTNNVVMNTLIIPEGFEKDFKEEFSEWGYLDKLKVNASSFSTRDSVIMYRNSAMYAVTRTGSNNSVDLCTNLEDFINENSPQSTITACLDASGMEQAVFALDIAQFRNGADDGLAEEFRTVVIVSHDSLDYPPIYNQANGEVVYHEFDLPIDYIGPFTIQIYTYSRERDAFEPVGVENLDAVLLDNLELFDRSEVEEEEDNPMMTEPDDYELNPSLVENEILITSPDAEVAYDVVIFDILGRKAFEGNFFGDTSISLGDAPSGTYFYFIREGRIIVKEGKLVKI